MPGESDSRSVRTVRAAIEALARGDAAGFLSLVDRKVVFCSLVAGADEAVYRGHDGARRWFAAVTMTLAGFQTELQEIEDAGADEVLATVVVRGALRGFEAPHTVRQTVTLRAGAIRDWRIHPSEALEALGCEMAKPQAARRTRP